jgi:RNA recognition motif-containing protein
MSSYAAEEGRLIYVSNLPNDVMERDIDNIFGKYGRIRAVSIKKLARPPPFAFVEFSDRRYGKDALGICNRYFSKDGSTAKQNFQALAYSS